MLRSIPTQEIVLCPIEIKELTNQNIMKSYLRKCDLSSVVQMFGITKSTNYKMKITRITRSRLKDVNMFSYVIDHALQHRMVVDFQSFIFARIKVIFTPKSLYRKIRKSFRPTICRAAIILKSIYILSTTLYTMSVKLEFVRIIKLMKFCIFGN